MGLFSCSLPHIRVLDALSRGKAIIPGEPETAGTRLERQWESRPLLLCARSLSFVPPFCRIRFFLMLRGVVAAASPPAAPVARARKLSPKGYLRVAGLRSKPLFCSAILTYLVFLMLRGVVRRQPPGSPLSARSLFFVPQFCRIRPFRWYVVCDRRRPPVARARKLR